MYLATPGPLAVTMITSHMAAIHDLTIAGLFIGKAGERAAQSHPRLTAAPGRPASNEGQERCTEVRANGTGGMLMRSVQRVWMSQPCCSYGVRVASTSYAIGADDTGMTHLRLFGLFGPGRIVVARAGTTVRSVEKGSCPRRTGAEVLTFEDE